METIYHYAAVILVVLDLVHCQEISAFVKKYPNTEHLYYLRDIFWEISMNVCARRCHETSYCHSFQYNRITGQCVTHPVVFGAMWESGIKEHLGNDVYVAINSHALGSTCASDNECTVINAACFNGACLCTPGFSYSQSENKCVSYCDAYGEAMTAYPDLAVGGNNVIEIHSSTLKYCLTACINQTSPLCLSFDYNSSLEYCALAVVGYLDVPPYERLEFPGEAWFLGTRDCAP